MSKETGTELDGRYLKLLEKTDYHVSSTLINLKDETILVPPTLSLISLFFYN